MAGYDTAFYDTIRPGVISSADVVVPIVHELVMPATVVDVGCGEGWWAHTFATYGADVLGVDGDYVPDGPIADRFLAHDLTTPLPAHLHGRFDLAVCLEVAEHLPPQRADSLVAELCGLAPVVLFSAAIPGQGGTGHVNEQWPSYWAEKFRSEGFLVSGALRWRIWEDDRIENWYRQNLLLAIGDQRLLGTRLWDLFRYEPDTPLPVVHPVLYDARRAR